MDFLDQKISLGRLYYPVKVLGPGNRVGIWMNGCRRNCSGCISPELRIYDSTKEVSVSKILQMIKYIDKPIDGFTISGGEPFYNPEALDALVSALAGICDDILIYTGYTLEELKLLNNAYVETILDNCSALIDGQYIAELNDNIGLRGSSNQKCRIFKYHEKYQGLESAERKLQNVVYGNKVLTIGIPQGE